MHIFTGTSFKSALENSVAALEFYKEHINRINVFPVPDGDTGSNMLATLKSGLPVSGWEEHGYQQPMGQTLKNIAEGCFWGARGNSGVLLSQFILGVAEYLHDYESCNTFDMLSAFESGTNSAYNAITTPTEGTMLSVMSRISKSVGKHTVSSQDLSSFWETLFYEARDAVENTTSQLEVLSQSGVVDSGAFGLLTIITGIWTFYSGESFENIDLAYLLDYSLLAERSKTRITPDIDPSNQWGFCTQLVVSAGRFNLPTIKSRLSKISESLITSKNNSALKIHTHTADPAAVLEYLRNQGDVTNVNIQNMDNQVSHDSAKYEPNQTVSLLAITQDYFDYIFKESGCTETISIRPGNTLTVSSMLSTITDSINSDLIIIPNNIAHDPITRLFDNALINGKTLRVLEANSLVHGLAALLAYNPFISLENNLASMRTALARTVSLAISLKTGTNCSRDTTTPTDIFVLSIDGTEIDFDTNISSLLQRIIMTHSTGKSPILTLFSGKHVCEEEATALVATLHSFAPNLSIELLSGGQEQPCYLASLE